MNRDRTPFGERMYESRIKAGLTQVQVREALNISQGTLSEAERIANSSTRVADFARLYKVDPTWLATGEEAESLPSHDLAHRLRSAGVEYRPMRTRQELADALADEGFPIPAEKISYVPDFIARGKDHLVFIETKPMGQKVNYAELSDRAAYLPGPLVVLGGMQSMDAGFAKLMEALGIDGSDTRSRGVAHDLSQARNTELLPKVRWEYLMTADLSRPFELDVIDDALAPEIFKGCTALLDPKREPEPAWPVLVRDRAGNFYLRDYEAGASGKWRALARARGYAPLDSETDGLTIVASMEGYKRPKQRR